MQFSSFFPLDVVEHRHEDDLVFEVFRLYVVPLQVHLDLLENSQCCKSWENVPLEFNCFSIKTHCVLVRWIPFEIFNLSCPFCIAVSLDSVLFYPHIALNLRGHKTFAFAHLITLNGVVFDEAGGYIENKASEGKVPMLVENGVCVVDEYVKGLIDTGEPDFEGLGERR